MDAATEQTLQQLNREFYARVAADFSRSRGRLQPGIRRVLDAEPIAGPVLDLGCGDARVGHALAEEGYEGEYLGVDLSRDLLGQRPAVVGIESLEADLTAEDWPARLAEATFDPVFCFSVLHHVPGRRLRLRVLRRIGGALRPGGRWALSVWQVLHRQRFRRRRRSWSEIGIDPAAVDEGDLLLDWAHDALRYVHHFEEEELRELCAESGLRVDTSFRSDGDSADLGLYLLGRV